MKMPCDLHFLSSPYEGYDAPKSFVPHRGGEGVRHRMKTMFELHFLSSPREGQIGDHPYRPVVPLPIGEGYGRGHGYERPNEKGTDTAGGMRRRWSQMGVEGCKDMTAPQLTRRPFESCGGGEDVATLPEIPSRRTDNAAVRQCCRCT